MEPWGDIYPGFTANGTPVIEPPPGVFGKFGQDIQNAQPQEYPRIGVYQGYRAIKSSNFMYLGNNYRLHIIQD